jgi:serine/threonine protein kinase
MIGEKLGKYTVLEIIGNGSMGAVYKAEDPAGQWVALRRVRSRILNTREKRERFLQCMLVVSEIRHPGVCPILEIGDDNDDFFVITPFINGRTLEHYMGQKPFPYARALDIALATGEALLAIHEAGTVHRGFKPANIWIRNDREGSVLIADCGITRFTETGRRGRFRSISQGMDFAETRIPSGALAYMSPEQVRGASVDYRTDIFSFGVVLYEMVCGHHPFEARNSIFRISAILEAEPPALISKPACIPLALQSILRRALAKDRDARYQSMKHLLVDMNGINETVSMQSRGTRMPAGFRKWLSSGLLRGLRK